MTSLNHLCGTLQDVVSTDTDTSHERRDNLVLGKSTILYTNNSMLDNVSSLDRIPAVTCVCKLLYVVLTNTSILS
jgi:hypothetical protein